MLGCPNNLFSRLSSMPALVVMAESGCLLLLQTAPRNRHQEIDR